MLDPTMFFVQQYWEHLHGKLTLYSVAPPVLLGSVQGVKGRELVEVLTVVKRKN